MNRVDLFPFPVPLSGAEPAASQVPTANTQPSAKREAGQFASELAARERWRIIARMEELEAAAAGLAIDTELGDSAFRDQAQRRAGPRALHDYVISLSCSCEYIEQ